MLTKGNTKLGTEIYGFALPSARKKTCKWMTKTCKRVCYDAKQEKFRPTMARARERNYQLSLQADFPQLVISLILYLQVKLLRIHTGGELYSATYARKWLKVMRRCKDTRFYLYTRAWRDEKVRRVLVKMARLKNVRLWYSADIETGVPANVPKRVRVAWLMTKHGEEPPEEGVDLVFRTQGLRRQPRTRIRGVRTCPAEDGVKRTKKVHCGNCNICWRPLPSSNQRMYSLPVLNA